MPIDLAFVTLTMRSWQVRLVINNQQPAQLEEGPEPKLCPALPL